MFEIRDEGALPSLAEVVGGNPQTKLDNQAVSEYSHKLTASGLPVATTMSATGDLRAMLERLFYRKFVRDLPNENCTLPWFECHVPPGGATVVRTADASTSTSSLKLNLFGSGVGRGRKLSVTISDASAPRTNCATYQFDLRVIPHLYEIRGRQSVELEIAELLGKSFVSIDNCPYCGLVPDKVDTSEFRFGEHLDLRKDKVTTTRKFRMEVEDSRSIEGGVKLSSLPVALKLSARVTNNYSLEVESQFPPGILYRAYTRSNAGPLQTEMWAIGGS
jgi:hypothetical protein